jgi:hypothetical protein
MVKINEITKNTEGLNYVDTITCTICFDEFSEAAV